MLVRESKSAPSNARLCPYSRETVAGCRLYRPRSEHGSGPDAADCGWSVATEPGPHLRTVICRRPAARQRVRVGEERRAAG